MQSPTMAKVETPQTESSQVKINISWQFTVGYGMEILRNPDASPESIKLVKTEFMKLARYADDKLKEEYED